MNHSLPNTTHSLTELRDELSAAADSWRSVFFGVAMGALHLIANTWALQKSRESRKLFRRVGHEPPGNWRR